MAQSPAKIARRQSEKKPSRFDRRKQEILNAAAVLINRNGLRETTLATVAAEIGLNLKSLRYYFERKEDLVSAVFHHSIELHRTLIEDCLAEDDFEKRIGRFVRSYFDLHAKVWRAEIPEFAHFGDLRALSGTQMTSVGEAYAEMFRAARRIFRPEEGAWDASQRSANAHLLISQLLWSVIWLGDYVVADFPRVSERLSDTLLNGFAAKDVDLTARSGDMPSPFKASERLSQDSFLRAATELINREGYRGASVDRISAVLQVTKGAFYHHNETRDQLVVACFERTFEIIREAQDLAMAGEMDGLSHVSAAMVSLVTRQMEPEGVLLRTSALTTIGPELRREMARALSHSTRRFADMLNDGLIDGSVRLCDIRIASEAVTATINSTEELQAWVAHATAANAGQLYVRPLLHGFRATRAEARPVN